MTDDLQIHCIVSRPFQENTYVLWLNDSTEALVIDAGLEPELILSFLEEQGLTAVGILCTHGHADHIGGNEFMKEQFPNAPLIIGEKEAPLLTDPNLNVSADFGFSIISPTADQTVNEGDVLELAGITLKILDVPGHSQGHIAYLREGSPGQVFSGDVLFRQGIGRDDFPGGDGDVLRRSIREVMYALPDETVVYPGHGPVTTPGFEKKNNPFVRLA